MYDKTVCPLKQCLKEFETDKVILLLNGPNINYIDKHYSEFGGDFSLEGIIRVTREEAQKFGYQVVSCQSNSEGALISYIQEAEEYRGILFNPSSLSSYSYALAETCSLYPGPILELYIRDLDDLPFPQNQSVIRPYCSGQVMGFQIESYRYGVRQLIEIIEGKRMPVFKGRTDLEYKNEVENG